FHFADRLSVIHDFAHRLAVDFQNDIATPQASVLRRTSGLDRGNDDALRPLEAQAFGDFRRHLLYRHAQLAFFRRGSHALLLLHLADGDGERGFFPIAQNFHRDLFIDRRTRDDVRQIVRVADLFTVELDDAIPAFDTGVTGGPAFGDVGDERAARLVHTERFGDLGSNLLDKDAEIASRDFPLALELRQQLLHQIHGNREADPDVAARAAVYRRIDSHDLAADVDERSAGITGINRGVGLDEAVVRPAPGQVAALAAHYTRSNGIIEAEWIADRHYPFAHFQLIGIAERRDRQSLVHTNFDDGEIGLGVSTDNPSVEFPAVGKLDDDLRRVVHDMVVGQNGSVFVDDEPGAQAFLPVRTARRWSARKFAPEIAERVVFAAERAVERLASLADLRRRDVDDHRLHPLRQSHEIRQPLRCKHRLRDGLRTRRVLPQIDDLRRL